MSVVKPFKRPSVVHESVSVNSSVVGQVIEVTDEGVAIVDFPQNTAGPIEARSLLRGSDYVRLEELPAQVLLTFENSDLSKPIVMGIISETLFAPAITEKIENDKTIRDTKISSREPSVNFDSSNQSTDLKVDGKRMTFDAKEEILLRCGKSSILLRKNGKIVIKGANLISRSSAANKIKGSSVNIN